MKLRMGFVSNSSTSSFLIYGTCIEECEMIEFLIKKGVLENDEDPKLEDGLCEVLEGVEGICKDIGMYTAYDTEYGLYFGLSWSCVEDDETGKQFKERIEKEIKETFGEDTKCETHSEAWSG